MNCCGRHVWTRARLATPLDGLRANFNLLSSSKSFVRFTATTTSAHDARIQYLDESGSLVLPSYAHLQDTQDIYVDDLDATLEAHRATNAAKIIRRVKAPPHPNVKHLIIEKDEDDCEAHAGVHEAGHPLKSVRKKAVKIKFIKQGPPEKESKTVQPWDFWPPGTVQYEQLAPTQLRSKSPNLQEYQARSMIPTNAWRRPALADAHTAECRPWLKHLQDLSGDALQRLGNEIIAFEHYMTPSAKESAAVTDVVSQAQAIVNSTVDESSLGVIGSQSTGIATPSSDIDIVITLEAIKRDAAAHNKSLTSLKYQKLYRKILVRIARAFADDSEFEANATFVPARVPIVRAMHRGTGLEVQVQIDTGSRQQQEYSLAYLAEYPTLRPLYFVFRSCLEIRRLNITFEGGLGSYLILMMIVNALKHGSGQYDPRDVGSQLLHVLNFYGNSDLYQHGFSIDPPRVFPKGSMSMTAEERMLRAADPVLRGIDSMASPNPRQPYLLCLQDPAALHADLGRKAYAIKHIQATFKKARQIIIGAMGAWNRRSDIFSKDDKAMGLLDALVCANYRRLNLRRNRLEDYVSAASDDLGIKQPIQPKIRRRSGAGEPKMSVGEMLDKLIEMENRKGRPEELPVPEKLNRPRRIG